MQMTYYVVSCIFNVLCILYKCIFHQKETHVATFQISCNKQKLDRYALAFGNTGYDKSYHFIPF